MGKRKRRADKNKAPAHPDQAYLGTPIVHGTCQNLAVASVKPAFYKLSYGRFELILIQILFAKPVSKVTDYQLAISDIIPHASQGDLQSKQRPFDQVESSASQELLMDAPGSSLKRSPGHESPHHQNHGSSHRILLRHSRHPFGRHYSRRSSSNYSDASPSNWKGSPVYDAKLSFKPESKDLSAFQYRGITYYSSTNLISGVNLKSELSWGGIFQKPERIRSNSFGENSISGDVRKMECRICQKRLRKHPFIFENSPSTNLSVVAVLVCGHVYHAECLEQKTSHGDSQDPPCPLCVSQTSSVV
ncbi:hypothetical protein SASPL_125718 [Salvia splendens]|uniref:RING-type domain-containing protein n=1 Tax=Salvia splendens TaxID=180675 RepID=A0A8X8ZQF5_SALSN|nr:hypothetical protein SASPL_125718 [Salvia splendens]